MVYILYEFWNFFRRITLSNYKIYNGHIIYSEPSFTQNMTIKLCIFRFIRVLFFI